MIAFTEYRVLFINPWMMVSGKPLPLIKDIVIVLDGKIQALRFTSDGAMDISNIMIIVVVIIIISQLKIFKRIFLNMHF